MVGSILVISGVFAGELGTECLPSLSRKAETAERRQHEPAATHKANSAASTATGRGKVKPLLGVKGQMQNKQLQARLEGKS